jgi:hypothetical protein
MEFSIIENKGAGKLQNFKIFLQKYFQAPLDRVLSVIMLQNIDSRITESNKIPKDCTASSLIFLRPSGNRGETTKIKLEFL